MYAILILQNNHLPSLVKGSHSSMPTNAPRRLSESAMDSPAAMRHLLRPQGLQPITSGHEASSAPARRTPAYHQRP
eukprot:1194145-Prorocentrum_minimum.AAC.3